MNTTFLYKIQLLLLILSFSVPPNANCQPSDYVLGITHCKLVCGTEFSYSSKVVIHNDTITIFQPAIDTEIIANRYAILDKKEKWKTPNYHGTTKYKVIQVSDQSKKNIQLVLKQGKGTVSISKNGECEIMLSVETK